MSAPDELNDPAAERSAAGRVLRRIEAAVGRISLLSQALAGIACLATFIVVCYTVFARYVLGDPLGWNEEVAGFLVVAMVMLAIPEAQRRGENINVDLLFDKLRRARRALYLLGAACVSLTALLIIVEGVEMVAFSRMLGLKSNTLPNVALWLVQLAVPIGGVLLLAVALLQLALWGKRLPPKDFERARDPTKDAIE